MVSKKKTNDSKRVMQRMQYWENEAKKGRRTTKMGTAMLKAFVEAKSVVAQPIKGVVNTSLNNNMR